MPSQFDDNKPMATNTPLNGDVLFVADALDTFNIKKDSTYVMMQALQARGARIWHTHVHDLQWQTSAPVTAVATPITLQSRSQQPKHTQAQTADTQWYAPAKAEQRALGDFACVLMRKDPPFDAEYIYATHLLEQATREGARVFNNPQALRNHPEKLALLEFGAFAPPTLVTRSAQAVRDFHALHQDIILKPLDGMGGMGIFRVKADGMNLGSITETLNQNGAATVMVQAYQAAIKEGDKRILLIGGEPVPFSLARIPQGTEIRGNLAAGGKGVAQPLSESDWAIANWFAPRLHARGLLLVGLDVIGDKVTEVNVTSPTCFQEITDQMGFDVAQRFADALQAELHAPAA